MTQLRGVFLTSGDPSRTARFYEQVAQLPIERVGDEGGYQYWKMDHNGMQLAIHASEPFSSYTHPPLAGSNLTHLYFRIEDHAGFLDHLGRLALTPFAVDDVVITVEDPDGRKVMFGVA
ncbi:MAG TPA: VOC family protein [Brevundimonas sp.]|jgi:hypothetical protein